MRSLVKLLVVIVFGPVVLVLVLLIVIAALVAAPLLWERLVTALTAPPDGSDTRA